MGVQQSNASSKKSAVAPSTLRAVARWQRLSKSSTPVSTPRPPHSSSSCSPFLPFASQQLGPDMTASPLCRRRGLKSPKVRRVLSKQLVSTDFGPAYDENLSAGGVQECIEKLARAEKYSHPNERVSTAVIDAGEDNAKDVVSSFRAASPEMIEFSMSQREFRCRTIPARELDNFEFLGDGSMGRVFSGTFRGKTVAVKTLRTSPTPLSEESWIHGRRSQTDARRTIEGLTEKCRQLQLEIGMLSCFTHPNILSFVACSISQDHIFLVTELMPLGSLYDFLRSSRHDRGYSTRDAFRFALDIAEACQYLHKLGIIHRDLKSANILVSVVQPDQNGMNQVPRFGVKIADFGCAVWKDQQTSYQQEALDKVSLQPSPPKCMSKIQPCPRISRICRESKKTVKSREASASEKTYQRHESTLSYGTLLYLSPEIMAGRSRNTTQSDVYAFGMLLSELLSRRCPYVSEGVPIQTITTLVLTHHRRPYLSSERRRQMRGLGVDSSSAKSSSGDIYLETLKVCLEPRARCRPSFEAICEKMRRFSEFAQRRDAVRERSRDKIDGNSSSRNDRSCGGEGGERRGRNPSRIFSQRNYPCCRIQLSDSQEMGVRSDEPLMEKIWRELCCPLPIKRQYVYLRDLASFTLFPPVLPPKVMSPKRNARYGYRAGGESRINEKRCLKDRTEDCDAFRAFVTNLRENLPYGSGSGGCDRVVDRWLFTSAFSSLTALERKCILKRWKTHLLSKRGGNPSDSSCSSYHSRDSARQGLAFAGG